MTPQFALSLSVDGIRFLRRGNGGWLLVADAALDDPALAMKLAQMRDVTLAEAPEARGAKLLLPNDQIRYMELPNPRATDADVRSALDGATPYALDELVYDYSRGPQQTYVAAVARETLNEAESFVIDTGLQPISFAAVPEAGMFEGEPFFGRSSHAIQQGINVERESSVLRVVGKAEIATEEPVEEPVTDQVAVIEPEQTEPETPPAPEPVADPEPVSEAKEETRPELPVAPELIFASRAAQSDTPTATPAVPPVSASKTPHEEIPSRIGSILKAAGTGTPPNMPTVTPTETARPAALDPAGPSGVGTAIGKVGKSVGGATAGALRSLQDRAERKRSEAEAANTARLEAEAAKVADALEAADDERQKMTVFGARKSAQKGARRPRFMLLILTLLLLVFLAVVAIWSSFTDTGLAWLWGGNTTETEVVSVVPDDSAPTETAAVVEEIPDTTGEALADLGDLEVEAQPDHEAAIAELQSDGSLLPPTHLPVGQILTPAEAQRIYAATGVWQRAPSFPFVPEAETTDNVTIAAIDPVTIGTDAVALPNSSAMQPDLSMVAPLTPPAPGTQFERDERGNILATPEGTVLPNGVVVYAGLPSPLPPARPADLGSQTDDAQAADTLTTNGASLAGLRPVARPNDLAENIERGSLGGYTTGELASRRPTARPGDFDVPTPEPTPEPPVADVAAIAAAIAEAAPADPTAGASALAVASSPEPAVRPRNFDRVVSAATPAPTAAPAVMAPTGPVPGGVATAATDTNVLNMRQMSLIGVSGSSSNRVATIRMRNGNIVTVRVGDRLNGGQVTAIGEHALNYVKRGQTYSLEMPPS